MSGTILGFQTVLRKIVYRSILLAVEKFHEKSSQQCVYLQITHKRAFNSIYRLNKHLIMTSQLDVINNGKLLSPSPNDSINHSCSPKFFMAQLIHRVEKYY